VPEAIGKHVFLVPTNYIYWPLFECKVQYIMRNISEENPGPDQTGPDDQQSGGTRDARGESMKDSMMESAENNDNSLIPNVDELTDKEGKLTEENVKDLQKPAAQQKNDRD
jgi:hypothetical protein